VVLALLPAKPRHAFAQATLLKEVSLQAAELVIEKVVRSMDQAEGDVRHDLRGTGLDELSEIFVGEWGLATEPANLLCFPGVLIPGFAVAGARPYQPGLHP
jgi:hypothetical protein